MTRKGHLILVVGPAGVGKDALMSGAAATLGPDYVFPKREITRSADAGGEDHIAVAREEFEARRSAGAYALSWDANDKLYGIPKSIEGELEAERTVVINVSREILAEARARFGPLLVVSLRAPLELLGQRMRARGREQEDEIQRKLARAARFSVEGDDVTEVWNDDTLETGINRFVRAIEPPIGAPSA